MLGDTAMAKVINLLERGMKETAFQGKPTGEILKGTFTTATAKEIQKGLQAHEAFLKEGNLLEKTAKQSVELINSNIKRFSELEKVLQEAEELSKNAIKSPGITPGKLGEFNLLLRKGVKHPELSKVITLQGFLSLKNLEGAAKVFQEKFQAFEGVLNHLKGKGVDLLGKNFGEAASGLQEFFNPHLLELSRMHGVSTQEMLKLAEYARQAQRPLARVLAMPYAQYLAVAGIGIAGTGFVKGVANYWNLNEKDEDGNLREKTWRDWLWAFKTAYNPWKEPSTYLEGIAFGFLGRYGFGKVKYDKVKDIEKIKAAAAKSGEKAQPEDYPQGD